jgi:hypothetical protein
VADALFALIEAAKSPVFVISHTRKKQGGAAGVEDISGSAQRGASADVALIVNADKDDSGKVASSTIKFDKVRDDVEEHPDPVRFTLVSRHLSWCSTEAPSRIDEEVFAALPEAPEAFTITNVRKALAAARGKPGDRANDKTTKRSLDRLVVNGRAVEVDIIGSKKGPLRGWRRGTDTTPVQADPRLANPVTRGSQHDE